MLGLLSLLLVITYLDRVCISVAGPRIQEALNIGPLGWGWVTGIFTLSYGGVRDSKRCPGRSHWSAACAHPNRVVVVGVHRADRRGHLGAVVGAMNSAAQVGTFISSVTFGLIVNRTGSYDAPFIPMIGLLVAGGWLWFRVDPNRALIPEPPLERLGLSVS